MSASDSDSLIPPADGPSPLVRRFVAWTLRRGKLLWALALLAAIPAAMRTASLYRHLRSDLEELLPRDAPSVVAIAELRQRMPGLQHLGVLVEVRDAAQLPGADRFLDDLAARVRAYPAHEVSEVRTGLATERAFVEAHAANLMELADLRSIRARIEDRLHWEYAKTTGTLLDANEPPPSLDFGDIERKYTGQIGGGALDGSRFSSKKLRLTLMLIEVAGFSTSAHEASALIHKVEADIRALGGVEGYVPGAHLGLTGDVAISSEETSALVEDLTVSSVLVIATVLLAIVLFYGWRRSVPALFLPLGVATVFAFAVASLPPFGVTQLNSNTAFLGSIIVGNGINFGIIQLARYVEARRQGQTVEDALVLALWGTRAGTLSAALAAGAAYASLVAMQFRGFRQFGVIGGLGMVFAWLTTVLLMPPLVSWLDRNGHGPTARVRPRRAIAGITRFVTGRPRTVVAAAALLTVLAGWQVHRFGRDRLEYDFSRLRRSDTWKIGEGYWGKKMDRLLGRYLTPTALLADSAAEARAIRDRIVTASAAPPLAGLIASVRTWDDVAPRDEDAKAAEVAIIRRKLTENVRDGVSPTDLAKLDKLLGPAEMLRIDPARIPDVLTRGLRERDGATGRAVLVYPNPNATWWRGETIVAFVQALREAAAAPAALGGRPARVAGGHPLSADIIASMERDGPLASLLAFLGVMATVLLVFRGGVATPYVIGSLIVGVLWLLAATMVLGIKINFVNFIAFPITFGIGVDYAVNVMARYLRDGGRDVSSAVRAAGGAVALCSFTTIVGYSSLLLAKNVGLFLFGVIAVLGEFTCLTTAVIVLPAVLIWTRSDDPDSKASPALVPPQAR